MGEHTHRQSVPSQARKKAEMAGISANNVSRRDLISVTRTILGHVAYRTYAGWQRI
jgi:hypothetical protein